LGTKRTTIYSIDFIDMGCECAPGFAFAFDSRLEGDMWGMCESCYEQSECCRASALDVVIGINGLIRTRYAGVVGLVQARVP
jgi:hypothetical protein